MSRLIVKNLANSVKSEKLSELFSQIGIVTDVQLKYTTDGKFRHFAFVGFRNEEDALKALGYFDNTFINGSRIKVEQCANLGDSKKPKSWSKYASDSSAYKNLHTQEKDGDRKEEKEPEKKKDSVISTVLKKYEKDPVFAEFMEARSKGNLAWGNDNVTNKKQNVSERESEDVSGCNDLEDDAKQEREGADESEEEEEEDEHSKLAKTDLSDMEYLKLKIKGDKIIKEEPPTMEEIKKVKKKTKEKKQEIFYTVKVRGIKYNSKKKDLKQFFQPLKPCSIRLPMKMKGIAYIGFSTEKEMKLALKKHMSFLAGRRISVLKYGGDIKHSVKALNSHSKWEEQTESLKNEETVAESGRIFVRNLAYTVTEADIESMFSKYGPLTEVAMPIDRISRKPKGFAVITFLMPEHAVKAYTDLDGSVLHGRMLHLIPGKYKKSLEEMLEMEGLTYKQKRALKAKVQAASSFNWNTLFLGQNAVADLIAKNYNTTKEKVLDARGDESIAVRLALGETELVNETRQFLLDNGVQIDAFNQAPTQRSKTVILVKNLPAETLVSEIHTLFAKFGELGRIILPPSGITAIVEFLEPSEARGAFRKLAYSKFKNIPLFLEWAPSNAFSAPYSGKKCEETNERIQSSRENETEEKNVKNKSNNKNEEEALIEKDISSEEEEEEPEPDTTLFIKNLNFTTEEEAIKEHFKKCGPIHYVTVAKRKDSKNPGNFLAMGYGFIQFKRKESLEKALKSYQNSVLDGFSLELKRSNRTLQSDVVTARKTTKIGKQTGSKILVRNIPFQAKHREIRDLFKTFGEIKALRLPQKMVGTGTHRGFAFVEYYTKHDAKRAFKALCQSTHLYGRRLVLEWAAVEEDVDELRKKTAHFLKNVPSNYQPRKGVAQFDMEVES